MRDAKAMERLGLKSTVLPREGVKGDSRENREAMEKDPPGCP
jgi:hypothetical protein